MNWGGIPKLEKTVNKHDFSAFIFPLFYLLALAQGWFKCGTMQQVWEAKMQREILSFSTWKSDTCVPETMCVCFFPFFFSLSPASRGNLCHRASLQQWEQLCRYLKLVFWTNELGGVGPVVPWVWGNPHYFLLCVFLLLYPKSSLSPAELYGNIGI